jgi:hypothetical protein
MLKRHAHVTWTKIARDTLNSGTWSMASPNRKMGAVAMAAALKIGH